MIRQTNRPPSERDGVPHGKRLLLVGRFVVRDFKQSQLSQHPIGNLSCGLTMVDASLCAPITLQLFADANPKLDSDRSQLEISDHSRDFSTTLPSFDCVLYSHYCPELTSLAFVYR